MSEESEKRATSTDTTKGAAPRAIAAKGLEFGEGEP